MSFGHACLLLTLAVVSISGGFDIILSSTGKCTLLYALGCLCRSRNALLFTLETYCAGKDATEDFEEIGHSNSAKEMLAKYVVGKYEVRGPSTWRSYERLCCGASKPASICLGSQLVLSEDAQGPCTLWKRHDKRANTHYAEIRERHFIQTSLPAA